jgi:deoxyribonuclease-1
VRQLAASLTIALSVTCAYILWHPPYELRERAPPSSESIPAPVSLSPSIGGNQRISNFREAKIQAESIYSDMTRTFYCDCAFSGHLIDHQSCGYVPQREAERAYRLEWEHVVPAAAFGKKMKAWAQGDPRCRSSTGTRYKGRRCARLVSAKFRQMEADLYNLVPEIGEMNQRRGVLPFVRELPESATHFGNCQTIIGSNAVLPRMEIRGFIARTYLYMEAAYPGYYMVNEKNAELFKQWAEKYPVTVMERKRGQRIAVHQGNSNPYLENN